MAARNLPEGRRRQALVLGGASAILIQFTFTLAVSYLIRVPGIRLVGALLLAGIACRLLRDDDGEASELNPDANLGRTVLNIALANLVMSLDNAIAVAGAGRQDPARLALGLIVSGTIILGSSSIILKIIGRFRWLSFAGAALLASTAAGMMWQDFEAAFSLAHLHMAVALGVAGSQGGALAFKAFVVSTCLSSPRWWPRPSST